MEYSADIQIYNSDEEDWEVWEIIADPSDGTFMLYWDDNGFDMDMDQVYRNNMLDKVKWNHDSARVMIIGLFEIGIKG